jgi:hypothetical protein
MTSFRISVIAAALLAVAAAALGQDQPPPQATGAPTPLGGPTPEASQPATSATDEIPPPSADDQPPAPPPVDYKPGMFGKPAQNAITTTDLSGQVDGPPAGTLDEAHGGLGASMWVNADRGAIEDLLARIPIVSADPFARSLARRVLLTPSEAPVGGAKRALVSIRLEKLLQGGLIEDAGALAALVKLDNDADYARVQAEALLYAGRDKDVCGDLTATRLTAPDPFWLELRTWCFAAGGDSASADLTRGVLDGQGIKDPAFDALMNDALSGGKLPVTGIEHPTALHIYLLRKAGLPVTNAIAAKLGTAANALAARETRNTPAERLAAAGRIAATGALSNAELLAILNIQQIAPKVLADPHGSAAKMTFLPAQGLLRRAAILESRPPAKTDLLLDALGAAGHLDRLPQTAALQADIALAVRPDPTTIKDRALIARALVLADKVDAAQAWYIGAADGSDRSVFQVLTAIAAPGGAHDTAAHDAFGWFAVNAAPQKSPDAASALALGLSDVLGKLMPPVARSLAATLEGQRWPGTRPSDDDSKALEQAASQPGRKGEVALRVLAIVGPGGPRALAPDVVVECVRVLQQAGMADDARRLAVEALAMAVSPP